VSRSTPARDRLQRIELAAVSVRLGARWALRDVSLDLRAGERWLLLGGNGAGKTVLLKLLRGDVWPTPTGREARRYHLRGGEVLSQPLFAADRIAYIGPERQDRYERRESTLDVAEVVLTGFDDSDLPLSAPTAAQHRRILQVLRQVGLAGWSKRRFRSLSYGQRRRVLLARAVVRSPDVLLLDEAMNGLDPQGRVAFLRALARATAPHTAYVLSTHRRDDAPADLTHVAQIADGRLESVRDLRETAGDTAASRMVPARPARRLRRSAQPSLRAEGAAQGSAGLLLRLRKAAVYRGERLVIGSFDWELACGQHWRLRGGNGAGKSTLVSVLYGDLWPAHGGERVRRWPLTDDWKPRVGLVSPELQATYAATVCTIEQIVASGWHASIGLNQPPTAAELRRTRRELQTWGLDGLEDRRARELSYGQLRLALVARAFVRARRLYLLDEPFDGLDESARKQLSRRLLVAVERGATVVMATHHDEDLPPYVTRELQLRRGRAPVIVNSTRAAVTPRRR
jgi:molybdate transport system ATP-binding protein